MNNQHSTAAPSINITPLIDILLVLLIIFMVIAPLQPARFETKIPAAQDEPSGKANPDQLIVTVDKDLRLQLNQLKDLGAVNDMSALNAALVKTFQQREINGHFRASGDGGKAEIEKTVFIKALRAVSYGEIAKVIDGVKGAGAHPIGL